jgi:hypothetical protein
MRKLEQDGVVSRSKAARRLAAKPFDAVAARVAVLRDQIAPALLPELRADPRAAVNPGLAAAAATLDAWVRDLGRPRDPAGALAADRLAAALRAAFVAAASRGRVVVGPGGARAALEMAARDLALVEAIRDLAAVLDAARGGAVVPAFDAWRDDTLAAILALGRHRASAATRRRGPGPAKPGAPRPIP